jgi:hypothetical protein
MNPVQVFERDYAHIGLAYMYMLKLGSDECDYLRSYIASADQKERVESCDEFLEGKTFFLNDNSIALCNA